MRVGLVSKNFRIVKGTFKICHEREEVALGLRSLRITCVVTRTLNFINGDLHSHFDPGSADQYWVHDHGHSA